MNTCFIRLKGDTLSAGNAVITREWKLRGTGLVATALRINGRSWIGPAEQAGTTPPDSGITAATSEPARLDIEEGTDGPIEIRSLRGRLTLGQHGLHIKVFPGIAAITLRLDGPAGTSIKTTAEKLADGIETDDESTELQHEYDLCERLPLPFAHPYLSIVHFADQSDHHDNLVREERLRISSCETLRARGNLFLIEDGLTQEGLILLKWAPLPHARPRQYGYDLQVTHREILMQGHGIGPMSCGESWSLLAYQGGRNGATRILHQLQRAIRPYRPGRDGIVLSNTWGDRNRDGRISEAFMKSEIACAAKLGIQVVQIDSGWEKGINANSVNRAQGGIWEGFWARDPGFWDVHPERFPRGLEPVADAAREAGVGLAFWFAPDSADEFENWEKDAARVLRFYRDLNVRAIKLDAIKIRSDLGAHRLRQFLKRLQDETRGELTVDLDITAEPRPGYFGAPDVGPLYVENRYTDWGSYWPHATLRNLRQLATWIDPLRLRMEFLNPRRNDSKYGDNPLRPMLWKMDALAAITLVASPLAFFELSELGAADGAALAGLLAAWRPHHETMRGAEVYPWNHGSDETGWSGFHVVNGPEQWILAFRVLSQEARCFLPGITASSVTSVYGDGTGRITPDGLNILVPETLGYAFLHLVR